MSKNIFYGEKFYSRMVLELIIVLLISFLLCIWIFFGSINRNGFFVYNNRNVEDSETSLKLTELGESFKESSRYSRNTRLSTTSSSSINEHIFKTLHPIADEVVFQSSTETPHAIDEPIFPPVASIKDYGNTQILDRDHSHMEELIDDIFPTQHFVPSEPLLWEGSGGYEDDFENYRPVQLIFPDDIVPNDSAVIFETATDKSPSKWFDSSTEYFLNAHTLNRPYRRQDNNNYFEIFDMDSSLTETSTQIQEPSVPTEIIELSYYINGGSDFAIVLDTTSSAVPLNNVEGRSSDEEDNDLFEAQLYNHEITTIEPINHHAIPLAKESIKYMDKFVEQDGNRLDPIDPSDLTYDQLFLVTKKNLMPLSTTMKPFNFFAKEFHMPNYEKPNFWNIFNPKFYQNNDLTMAQSKPSASHWYPFVNALKLDSFLPQENHARHDFERFSNALNKRIIPISPFERRTTDIPIQEVEHIPEFVKILGKSNSFIADQDRSKWQSHFSNFAQFFNEPKAPCRHHPSLFRFWNEI